MRKYFLEIVKHSTIYTIGNFLTRAMGVLLIPLYTHYLTTSDYGIVSNVVAIINFFSVIFLFGMDAVWGRYYFDYEDGSTDQKIFLGNIFIFLVLLGLSILFVVTVWGEPFFNYVLPDLKFWPYVLLGVYTAFLGVFFRLKKMIFRVRQQSLQFGFLSLGRFLVTLILIIVAVVGLRLGALGKVSAEFLAWLIFAFICIFFIRKDILLKIDFSKLKHALKYAISIFPHSLTGILVNVFDRVFMTNFKGLSATGIYTIGFQVGSIMNLIVYSINLSWSPFFMKIAKEKGEDAKPIISRLSSYYILFICFLGLGITLFSQEIIVLTTTKEYYAAATIVPIYVFAFVINGFYFLHAVKIFYVKKATKFIALASITAAAVNLFLNIQLIPSLGMIGAAWARFISTIVLFIITFIISQRFYYIKYDYKLIVSVIGMTAVIILIFEMIGKYTTVSIFYFIIIKMALLAGYISIPFLLNFIKISELRSLLKNLKK